jgi:choline dehydrogenase
MAAYIEHKAGPFTNAPTTTGFTSLHIADPNLKEPEKHIQSIVAAFQKAHPDADPAGRNPLLARQLTDRNEAVGQMVLLGVGANISNVEFPSKIFLHDAPGNWITLGICSTRSLSRGSVHIESSDPTKQPVIDPAYFSHPLDLDIAARSILHMISLMSVEPMASVLKRDANGGLIIHPSWTKEMPKTVEEAKELAAANTVTEVYCFSIPCAFDCLCANSYYSIIPLALVPCCLKRRAVLLIAI